MGGAIARPARRTLWQREHPDEYEQGGSGGQTWVQPALWTTGDWNTFFGFGTNILVNMLVLRRDHGATRRGIRMWRRHDLKDAVPFRSKRKRVKQH